MPDKALADKKFLGRVQESFDIEDMTEENLKEWLYHGEKGKHLVSKGLRDKKQIYREVKGKPLTPKTIELAKRLSEISKYYKDIERIENIDKLREIKKEIKELPVYSPELEYMTNLKIKERLIAESFVRVEELAREKGIMLSEKIIGRLENWKGEDILTIRERGRFITWKKI